MNGRRFRTHDWRLVDALDGIWDFAFLGSADPDSLRIGSIRFNDRMAVPGSFDATPAYAGRRGLAAYRTRILLRDSVPYRLVFHGVHHWCRVFLDGEALADHSGGFTRFQLDIGEHEPGLAELIVLVDNRFNYERSPLHQEYFDWYHYGGITRPVELERLGEIWIERLWVTTEQIDPPILRVALEFDAIEPAGTSMLIIALDDEPVFEESLELNNLYGYIERRIEVPDAALWSPEQPNLHSLHVRLGRDDMRERVGIRQVRVEGRQILLNEQPLRLLGFCRHESHPQFGCALPDEVLVSDVQLLRDLNCNFVRGSHYPQDERFLDLCDEAGICVWNEATGWQHDAEQLTDERFVNAETANIEEMVAMSQNHASVILWGILNESHSHDPRCRPAYEQLLGRLRELDATRPVTYASNHPFEDVCLDLVDVVSINSYPGWYQGSIEEIPALLDKIVEHLDANGQAEKPLILSEIGAGAVPGWRDMNQTRWSEQYQARLLETVIRYLFEERQRACGLSLWQFCDVRTSQMAAKILGRPRGFNNKGVLDEYRRPKLGYAVVKELYGRLRKESTKGTKKHE